MIVSDFSGAMVDAAGRHAAELGLANVECRVPGLAKARQVQLILARHGIEPQEVVFVGDAPRDHELLNGAGVRFVGIHRLFDAREFRRRGLPSFDGLAGLTRSWEQLERRRRRAEPPRGLRPR